MLKDSSNKICFICLEEDSVENNSLVEYNHCGIYYIHTNCLNNWDPNDCLICRSKIISEEPNEQIESPVNNNTIIEIPYNDNTLIEIRPSNNRILVKAFVCLILSVNSFIIVYFVTS